MSEPLDFWLSVAGMLLIIGVPCLLLTRWQMLEIDRERKKRSPRICTVSRHRRRPQGQTREHPGIVSGYPALNRARFVVRRPVILYAQRKIR